MTRIIHSGAWGLALIVSSRTGEPPTSLPRLTRVSSPHDEEVQDDGMAVAETRVATVA